MFDRLSRASVFVLGASVFAGCSAGTYTAPPRVVPATITVKPTTLDFAGVSTAANGYAYDQTVTGQLSAQATVSVDASSCVQNGAAIATALDPVQSGLSLTVTVRPLAAGSCTVTLTTPGGSSASVSITVNDASVGLTGARRRP
ncbi:MAG TPA: hypothetical protein VFB22_15175 [Candidatus Baltobacteraceae bacterium]|nr:hypothetical protein [Candidatus Baltobacteraceae bacterium]